MVNTFIRLIELQWKSFARDWFDNF